jgi:hypothetical protein
MQRLRFARLSVKRKSCKGAQESKHRSLPLRFYAFREIAHSRISADPAAVAARKKSAVKDLQNFQARVRAISPDMRLCWEVAKRRQALCQETHRASARHDHQRYRFAFRNIAEGASAEAETSSQGDPIKRPEASSLRRKSG